MRQYARQGVPWYLWPLNFLVYFVVLVVVWPPLVALTLLSIPYFAVYPDSRFKLNDVHLTDRQIELFEKWRSAYRSLGLFGRIRRAMKLERRRWRRYFRNR